MKNEVVDRTSSGESRSTRAVGIIPATPKVRGHIKQLFVSQSLVEVESLKELLGEAGILCTIKNQQTSTFAGAVPFAEVFPELWVLRDEDFDQAKVLMEDRPKTLESTKPP